MKEERRRHPRAIVNWPAALNSPDGSLEGEVKDISMGGVCILFPEEPTVTENFFIFLKPSDQRTIPVIGEKVWSGKFDVTYGTVFGMGIRFTYIAPEDRQYIATRVEEELNE